MGFIFAVSFHLILKIMAFIIAIICAVAWIGEALHDGANLK